MTGKIIKGIAGFYYVHVPDSGVYECKAKGVFRSKNIKPLVGDNVEISVLDEEKKLGNIDSIEKRKNQLIRPTVSNIDQAIVIFAAAEPEPNFNLLDRFLIQMEKEKVRTIICFNKRDIVNNARIAELKDIYISCGYPVCFTSTLEEEGGLEEIRRLIRGKTTVLAGPSGVGKSSIINCLQPEANMETGKISQKIQRGKHTTRHSELIYVEKDTYMMDTPGFSSLYVEQMEKEDLKNYFVEFHTYEEQCRFAGCNHINEPDCAVKDALEEKKISPVRYQNYCYIFEELKEKRRY